MSAQTPSADTLKLTLEQADSLFLKNNFQLLISRYQVKSDSALIRQARLWDNPSFTAELGMNSWSDPKLRIGNNGQTAYSIDQVIQLAGKRSKNVALATLNADYSESSFQEVMRTLRWQLHSNFTDYYFKYKTIQVLKEQQQILGRIVKAYQRADSSGSVAHADYIRLAQLQMSLKSDYLSTAGALNDLQLTLQQLLGTTSPVLPSPSEETLMAEINGELTLDGLVKKALQDRPDVRMSLLDKKTAQANYSLQKALAVPDLHVGALYDKNSGVVHNYMGLTMGIDLPFWNRNQGNIRSSRLLVDQAGYKWEQRQNTVITEVSGAYDKLQDYKNAFQPGELSKFQKSFNTLIGHVAENFTKGNITLLQFIDFFNSYSDNFNDQNGYYSALYDAYNDLEYAVGTSLRQ
jgi:cobalt-zinc-cadmium efflux system outer membrane protein